MSEKKDKQQSDDTSKTNEPDFDVQVPDLSFGLEDQSDE